MKSSNDGEKRQLQPPELWGQVTNAIRMRASQDQVLWSISGIFMAANAVLLVALFQGGKLPESLTPRIVIPLVGTILSTIQYCLQGRAFGHVGRLDELIRKLESALDFDHRYAVSVRINTSDADRYLSGRRENVLRRLFIRGTFFHTRTLMQGASVGAALLWLATLAFFVLRGI